jgi:hypothetical protein
MEDKYYTSPRLSAQFHNAPQMMDSLPTRECRASDHNALHHLSTPQLTKIEFFIIHHYSPKNILIELCLLNLFPLYQISILGVRFMGVGLS